MQHNAAPHGCQRWRKDSGADTGQLNVVAGVWFERHQGRAKCTDPVRDAGGKGPLRRREPTGREGRAGPCSIGKAESHCEEQH